MLLLCITFHYLCVTFDYFLMNTSHYVPQNILLKYYIYFINIISITTNHHRVTSSPCRTLMRCFLCNSSRPIVQGSSSYCTATYGTSKWYRTIRIFQIVVEIFSLFKINNFRNHYSIIYLVFNFFHCMTMLVKNVLAYKGWSSELFTTERTKILVFSKFLCIDFNKLLYLSIRC